MSNSPSAAPSSDQPPAAPRSVVVTGAAKGIGRAIAERLTADGFAVVAVDLDAEALSDAVAQGAAQAAVEGDIAVWDTHEQAAAAAERIGRLHGWVNNAGVDVAGAAHEVTAEQLRDALAVLQLGPMFGCCVAVRRMLPHRAGSIVNVGSIQGVVAFPGYLAYQAAKAAIAMVARGIATDYGPYGIRCNTILPGTIDTPMTRAALAGEADVDAALRREAELAPLQRVGEAREVADAVAYLISDASSFVSGAQLAVDGGATARCYPYPPLDVPGR